MNFESSIEARAWKPEGGEAGVVDQHVDHDPCEGCGSGKDVPCGYHQKVVVSANLFARGNGVAEVVTDRGSAAALRWQAATATSAVGRRRPPCFSHRQQTSAAISVGVTLRR